MEGPKVPSEAQRREAPECRGGWGLGRGAVAPRPLPSMGPGGIAPRNFFRKINIEIAHFHSFVMLQLQHLACDTS